MSLQVTCWLCGSSVISQHPSVRRMSAAGFLCTGRWCNLWFWSWRRCCTVGKRSTILLQSISQFREWTRKNQTDGDVLSEYIWIIIALNTLNVKSKQEIISIHVKYLFLFILFNKSTLIFILLHSFCSIISVCIVRINVQLLHEALKEGFTLINCDKLFNHSDERNWERYSHYDRNNYLILKIPLRVRFKKTYMVKFSGLFAGKKVSSTSLQK